MSSSFVGKYIVNEALVKIIDTPESSISVLVYDRSNNKFERNFGFLSMIMYGREDIKKLSEDEFEKAVLEQRKDFLMRTRSA
jgi:hypothetical protein